MSLFTQENPEELLRADAERDSDNREKRNEYYRAYRRKKRAEAHTKSKEE